MGTMMKTTVSTTANVRARGTVRGVRADMGSMYFYSRVRVSRSRVSERRRRRRRRRVTTRG